MEIKIGQALGCLVGVFVVSPSDVFVGEALLNGKAPAVIEAEPREKML